LKQKKSIFFIFATAILAVAVLSSIFLKGFLFKYKKSYYVDLSSEIAEDFDGSIKNIDNLLKNVSSDVLFHKDIDIDINKRLSFYFNIFSEKISAISFYRFKDNKFFNYPNMDLDYSNFLRLLDKNQVSIGKLSYPLSLNKKTNLVYILEPLISDNKKVTGYIIAQILSDRLPKGFIKKIISIGDNISNKIHIDEKHIFLLMTDEKNLVKLSNSKKFIAQGALVSTYDGNRQLSITNIGDSKKFIILSDFKKKVLGSSCNFYLITDKYFSKVILSSTNLKVLILVLVILFLSSLLSLLFLYSSCKYNESEIEKKKRDKIQNLSIRLTESERKYSTLLEASPMGIYVIQDRKLKYVNNAFRSMFQKFTEKDLLELNIEDFIHTDDKIKALESLKKRQDGKDQTRHYFLRICPTSDKIIDCEVVSTNFTYNGENAVLGFIRDVTDEEIKNRKIRKINQELIELNNKLKHNDNIKDEFLSNLSHELRTPIVPIKGYLELFLQGGVGQLTNEQNRIILIMRKSVIRLLSIVTNLLTMTSLIVNDKKLVLSEININKMIKKLISKKSDIADEKNIEIDFSSTSEDINIKACKYKLETAFEAIIDNAIKFNKENGSLKINMTTIDNNQVKITFSDTGIGIKKEDFPFVYDDFYLSDPSPTRRYGGLGIGLSITKKIIEMHGGYVNIISDENVGSTVEIILNKEINIE